MEIGNREPVLWSLLKIFLDFVDGRIDGKGRFMKFMKFNKSRNIMKYRRRRLSKISFAIVNFVKMKLFLSPE